MEFAAIIATILGGVAALGYFYEKWRRWRRRRLASFKPRESAKNPSSTVQEFPSDKAQAIDALLSYLRNDQDHSGLHHCQFGRGQRTSEEERYQTTKEKLDTKPRLYLTGWPVFVFVKHREKLPVAEMLDLTKTGILGLFNDGWIHISMGAHRFTNPVTSARRESVISYRHTIRAVQILLAIDNSLSMPKVILGKMLDPGSDMQTKEGGWRQCNVDFPDEDLWGSAYAAGFLSTCIKEGTHLSLDSNAMDNARKRLARTLIWLHKKWNSGAWVYDEVPTEENAPILLPEIVDPAIEHRPKLAISVLNRFEGYLDPTHQPSSSYLNKTCIVGPCAATIRLAYNFFVSRRFRAHGGARWNALVDYALQHMRSGHNCVEAAMLLDMLLTDTKDSE
ncbi:MAG: hypothetical protein AABN33_04490 [Acidobacteriota bacterium]